MTDKFKKIITYVLVALIFFVAGMIFSPEGKVVRGIKKSLQYTKAVAQKLYDGWEKENLFFDDGTSLKDFEDSNETYIIYFWAAWCPHCRNINSDVNSLKDAGLPVIGLTFDRQREEYDSYLAENPPFWKDLFCKNEDGNLDFCPRTDSLNIPSIPSVWVVKSGKVREIYRGEKKIRKFCEKTKKS